MTGVADHRGACRASTTPVLVTGGASGIGAAFARLALNRSVPCFMVDRVPPGDPVLTAAISAGSVMFQQADITCPQEVEAALDRAWATVGPVRGYFNNAGVLGPRVPLPLVGVEDWDLVVGVNLRGTLHCLGAQLRRATAPTAIVNMASISGLRGSAAYPLYAAAKHAVVGLTRSVALSHGPDGIRVNALCPALVETPMTRTERAHHGGDPESDAAAIPLGRTANAEEIAIAAHWLLSDEAGYMNGHCLVLDGGASA